MGLLLLYTEHVFSKKKLAREVDLPPSTVSYFIETYGEFFKSFEIVNSGTRYPRYSAGAVQLLQKIIELNPRLNGVEFVRGELGKTNNIIEEAEEAETTENVQQQGGGTTAIQQQLGLVATTTTSAAVQLMSDQKIVVEAQQERIAELKQQEAEAQERVGELEKEQADLVKQHDNETTKLKSKHSDEVGELNKKNDELQQQLKQLKSKKWYQFAPADLEE